MAQFIAFNKNAEVNGETAISVVHVFPEFIKNIGYKILKDNGIDNPQPGKWYNQQAWLDAFKEISRKFGDNTLFEIGKVIPKNAKFPSEISNLQKALLSIDIAYHTNHRGGEIGNYKLTSFNESAKNAVMVCKNPYPCEFDRGLITSMLRSFKSKAAIAFDVVTDTTKPRRKTGADSSTYNIIW